MIDAQTILKMIEEVDPADTERLFEIDKAVALYLYPECAEMISCAIRHEVARFCTSRDALKAIRPDGWTLTVIGDDGSGDGTRVKLTKWSLGHGYKICERCCQAWLMGDKEELAELHAVIQAIDHDRGQR